MQNEEVNSRVIAIVKQGGKITAEQLIKLMKKLLEGRKGKSKSTQEKEGLLSKFKKVKVKDLVKKGKVETLELNDIDLKNLKKRIKSLWRKI